MKKILTLILTLGLVATSCNLDYYPYDAKMTEDILSTEEGIDGATLGNYDIMKSYSYQRWLHFFGEYAGDNVSLSGTTSDHLFFIYNYQHQANTYATRDFWLLAYREIVGANKCIEAIGKIEAAKGETENLNQLKGENYFLRALAHLQLVNIFGRPYQQSPETNLGVPLKLTTDVNDNPGRATVKEVYEQIVSDLKTAEGLMGSNKNSCYASKEVAQALLSRVYLYMDKYQECTDYANLVINSNRYSLEEGNSFKNYFRKIPEENSETIFAIRHVVDKDDQGWGAIGSMYYSSPSGNGWGEMYASQTYRDLLDKYPQDYRHAFIEPQVKEIKPDGTIVYKDRNGFPMVYINKFSYQEDKVFLSSPVVVRLAEIYLNRAEAYAKQGQDQLALDDINLIRKRAGLANDALYTIADLKGYPDVLSAAIDERRLELAFEAHRKYDVFRNNRALDRSYPGTHRNAGADWYSIPATHARVVQFIPQDEINANPRLADQQNP